MHRHSHRENLSPREDEQDDDGSFETSDEEELETEDSDLPHNHRTSPNPPGFDRSVSYFEGSSNFVINGGDYSTIGGNVYIGSPPPGSPPTHPRRRPAYAQQSSSVSYFPRTSNFEINNGNFRAVAGDQYDYSTGSGGRRQTNAEPPSPDSGASRGSGGARGGANNAFRNGSTRGFQPSSWPTTSVFSHTTLRNESEGSINHDRTPANYEPTFPVSESSNRMDVVEDSVGGETSTAPSSVSDPVKGTGDVHQDTQGPTAVGNADASTSSAANISTGPGPISISQLDYTMRAEAPSNFSENDINRPTVLGPEPNRESSPQPVATQSTEAVSLPPDADNNPATVNSAKKSKNPLKRMMNKVVKSHQT